MLSNKTILSLLCIIVGLIFTIPVHAQDLCPNTDPGLGAVLLGKYFSGLGPLGDTTGVCTTAGPRFIRTISQIIGLMTVIGGLWFVFTLFTGALAWISAGSDKQALDNAKKKITNGTIGLLVVVVSYALLGVIGFFLGFDILNLKSLIESLDPTK